MEISKKIMFFGEGGVNLNLEQNSCAFSWSCSNNVYNFNWRAAR